MKQILMNLESEVHKEDVQIFAFIVNCEEMELRENSCSIKYSTQTV